MQKCLDVGRSQTRELPGSHPIRYGLARLARLGEMMRDNLRLCSDEAGKRLLESAGDHGMQLGPSALQQTFVGGIANQSMTEAMVLVGADTGCNNQSGSVQFVQCLAKTLLR